ncbi:MAG TPA: NIPSNAP family protein [Bryobacteraceae bacterium]|nr:NIPSNAP family protein [Bryobacteraceae bacterium]
MKASHFVSFALGAVCMLAVSMVNPSQAQSPNHVFEYRVYHANPGKLDDLHKRFREHTIEIFNRHHMKSVGYWVPQDNKDNILMYILEHPSREEAAKNWAAFRNDPEWQKVAKASEVNGKLVDHVDSTFINPTDYSPMK